MVRNNIAIVGAVKSVTLNVGRRLADILEMYLLDSDEYVDYEMCLTHREMLEDYGEQFYYSAEYEKMSRLNGFDNSLIVLAPTCLKSHPNLRKLKEFCYIIVLDADPITEKKRFLADDSLYMKSRLKYDLPECLRKKSRWAKIYADITVNVDKLDYKAIEDEILTKLEEMFV